MRKHIENGLLMMSYVFGLLSVIVTTIIIVDPMVVAEGVNNRLMNTLVYIISFTFIASAVGYIYMNFSSSKAVSEILIYQNECSRTKVTKKVIRKLIGQAVAGETFVKVNRVKLLVVDGTLHLIVFVSLTESNVPYYIDYLKALIGNVMDHTLKLVNYRTDFKVKKLNTAYDVPRAEIMQEIEAQYENEEQAKAAEREALQENLGGKDAVENKSGRQNPKELEFSEESVVSEEIDETEEV